MSMKMERLTALVEMKRIVIQRANFTPVESYCNEHQQTNCCMRYTKQRTRHTQFYLRNLTESHMGTDRQTTAIIRRFVLRQFKSEITG